MSDVRIGSKKAVIEPFSIEDEVLADLSSFRQDLIYVPDNILQIHSVPVDTSEIFRPSLKSQLRCQYATMRLSGGVGMAAVQMDYPFLVGGGYPNQVITYELPGSGPRWLINPTIIEQSEEIQLCEEGCLSVPTVFYTRERAASITVAHVTTEGESTTTHFDGFAAVVIQHEIDHLEGKLFTDDMSILKKGRARLKVAKYLRSKKRLS